jgi:surface polysaccharide O-acyltransferase-like enzyme
MKHIIWIDYAKSIAIFLVVLLHYGSDTGSDQSWYEPLIGILGGFATSTATPWQKYRF